MRDTVTIRISVLRSFKCMWKQKRKMWNLAHAVYMSRLTYEICRVCGYHLIGCRGREKVENYSSGWQNHRALGGRDLERLDQSTTWCLRLLYSTQGTLPLRVAGFPWGSSQEQKVLVIGQNLPPRSFSYPGWPAYAAHTKQTDSLNVSTLKYYIVPTFSSEFFLPS